MINVKDYCTLFFDKIGDYDISGCCYMHDEEYEDFDIPREIADDNLRLCVNQTTKSKIGNVMFLGVRVFGRFFWWWYRRNNKKYK